MIIRADLAKKYPPHADRVGADAQSAIYPELEKWSADKTKEQVWEECKKNGLVSQPVWNSKEVSAQEHYHLRGTLAWIDDPTFGDVQTQVHPALMSETPPRCRWGFKPVGAGNEHILAKVCGLSGSGRGQGWPQAVPHRKLNR